ncbi:hypothetical protein [Rhodococcus sp. NPDC058521]|uniref:hypothetical protein n=1 Tax=Rhodococcus sp. NPDC058521 TaxID=3346536 RepID=UPI00365408C9
MKTANPLDELTRITRSFELITQRPWDTKALDALPTLAAVGITPEPGTLTALDTHRTTREALDRTTRELAPPPLDTDPRTDNYAHRIREHIIGQHITEHAAPIISRHRFTAAARVAQAIVADAPAMLDQLQTIYEDKHSDILGAEDPATSTILRAERQILTQKLAQAHNLLLDLNTPHNRRFDHYAEPYFRTHSWTGQQYQQLVDSTGARLTLQRDPSIWHAAARIGTPINLARTHDDPNTRYQAAHHHTDFEAAETARERARRAAIRIF